ncbi:MAG: SDR family oxidoreductase [Rhizobiaceae bacterium]|nr:SDR family oxidoreductase [Rhizobiaceae bacterium]
MNIDLAGRNVLVDGSDGVLIAAIALALADNGGAVRRIAPRAQADITADDGSLLIFVSDGAAGADTGTEGRTGEADRLELLARTPGLGRVVTVFSAAGIVPIRGLARFSAEQAGLASLTRTLAMELGPHTRVNGVAVGAYEAGGAVVMSRLLSHAAVKRPAGLAEIVAAVMCLADPDNSYMTGHVLAVDGGWSAGYARNF